MKRLSAVTLAAVCLFTLISAAQAQDSGMEPAKGTSAGSSAAAHGDPGDAAEADSHALSGAVRQGVGSWGERRSFYVPGFRLASNLDSNPQLGGLAGSGLRGYANMDAELQLVHFWSRNTELRYTGALRFDSLSQSGVDRRFTNAHSASLAHRWVSRRWMLMLNDQADYSLTSNFAGAGMEGLGDVVTDAGQWGAMPDIQLASNLLQQQYLPNQSILTARSARISNTVLGELDYRLSPRSQVTFTADYGLLHFRSAGLVDTDQVAASAGYDYQPSARDTVAVQYVFGVFRFPGIDYRVQESAVELRYSRRLTGRLSIGAGAGPEYVQQLQSPSNSSEVGWQADGQVQYRRGRVALDASAGRMITGGAGVLYGAQTVTASGGVGYDWSRRWVSKVDFGVSRNSALGSGQNFGTQFVNCTVTRRMGRYSAWFFTYYFAHQSAAQGCNGSACGLTGTRQVGGIGLRWSYRPMPMGL